MRKFSELTEEEKINIRNKLEIDLGLICYFSLLISYILFYILPFNIIGLIISTIWFKINIIASILTDNDIPFASIFFKILDLISSGVFALVMFLKCLNF